VRGAGDVAGVAGVAGEPPTLTGTPTVSMTVGAFAEAADAVVFAGAAAGASEYESETIGTLRGFVRWTAGAEPIEGTTGAAWSLGTVSFAKVTDGTRSVGSGATVVTGPGMRSA